MPSRVRMSNAEIAVAAYSEGGGQVVVDVFGVLTVCELFGLVEDRLRALAYVTGGGLDELVVGLT